MNITDNNVKPYSKLIVALLKGIVEDSNKSKWEDILFYKNEIRAYVGQIGLDLVLKEDDGYAFLRQIELNDGSTIGIMSRRKMSFGASVILVILRQILEDFEKDIDSFNTSEKYISEDKLKEEIEDFLPKDYDLVKFYSTLKGDIQRIFELGFLKKTTADNGETIYIIHKIIKEKVTIDVLLQFKQNLENYGL